MWSLLFYFRDDSSEGFRGLFSKCRKHFAVYGDLGLLEGTNKFAVRKLLIDLIQPRIDADIPEAAEVVLFIAAVCKCVFTSMEDSLASLRSFLSSGQSDIPWSLPRYFCGALTNLLLLLRVPYINS